MTLQFFVMAHQSVTQRASLQSFLKSTEAEVAIHLDKKLSKSRRFFAYNYARLIGCRTIPSRAVYWAGGGVKSNCNSMLCVSC